MNRPLSACVDPRQDNAVLLRVSALTKLSAAETDTLRDLPQTARHHPAHSELCIEGKVQAPLVLLSGWACYQRILGDGRRQIVRFLLPGDAVGPLGRPALPSPSTAMALTSVVVADAHPLICPDSAGSTSMPGLAEAVGKMAYADEINLRDQIVRLGRQTAYERLLHLVLEFHHRLQVIGMVNGDSFSLPLTQEILADALGLSVVHVNRTLQQVRRDRLLEMRGGQVTLRQLDLMRAMADWVAPAA